MQVVSVAIKQIKREIYDRRLAQLLFARRAHVHALLQPLEVGVPARIERHNFTIHNRLPGSKNFGKPRQLGVARSDIQVVSRA